MEALDKKYDAIESKHGYPPKRRCRLFVGGGSTDTLVIEREWESFAAKEAAYEKVFIDSEGQAIRADASEIIVENQIELLLPM